MARLRVLDSWSLMAFFEDEPGAERVETLLLDAEKSGQPLLMSVINWGEVWYSIARRQGKKIAEQFIQDIDKMAIEIVDVDLTLTRIAAEIKSKHKMSFADCFAAALSKQQKAELVTGDKEFKQVEGAINIAWV